MVLDGESLLLAPRADELIAASEGTGLPGTLKSELFASALELTTNVCESAEEAAEALAELRRGAAALAEEKGLLVAAAGTHPISRPEDQEIADEQRYAEFVGYAGVSARRQGVSGLHVHVGMPSADACFHALEGVLPWLPVVLALSANSPYLSGEETGMLSNRAEVLAQLPRSGAPPAFRSYAEWEEFVELFARVDVSAEYTRFWWDIRPHPRFGTLEVRMPDQPTALERTQASRRCSSSFAGRCSTARSARGSPRPAASTSRTAGRPRASASPPSSSIPTESTPRRPRELAEELARREDGRVGDRGRAAAGSRPFAGARGRLRGPGRANARLGTWLFEPRRFR